MLALDGGRVLLVEDPTVADEAKRQPELLERIALVEVLGKLRTLAVEALRVLPRLCRVLDEHLPAVVGGLLLLLLVAVLLGAAFASLSNASACLRATARP